MKKKKNKAGDMEVNELQSQAVLNAAAKAKALRRISQCITAMAIAYILPKLLWFHFAIIEAGVKRTLENSREVNN